MQPQNQALAAQERYIDMDKCALTGRTSQQGTAASHLTSTSMSAGNLGYRSRNQRAPCVLHKLLDDSALRTFLVEPAPNTMDIGSPCAAACRHAASSCGVKRISTACLRCGAKHSSCCLASSITLAAHGGCRRLLHAQRGNARLPKSSCRSGNSYEMQRTSPLVACQRPSSSPLCTPPFVTKLKLAIKLPRARCMRSAILCSKSHACC